MEAGGGRQSREIVQCREVAGEEVRGTDLGGGDPQAGRDEPIDAVGAPVRCDPHRTPRRGEHQIDVANRHRGGGVEDRAVGDRLGHRPHHAGLVRERLGASGVGERSSRGSLGRRPVVGPVLGGRWGVESGKQCCGVGMQVADRSGRIAPSGGIDGDLSHRRVGLEPGPDGLGGGEGPDPEHHFGPGAIPEAGGGEHVTGGHHPGAVVGTGPEPRERIGDDRDARPGRPGAEHPGELRVVLRSAHDQGAATADRGEGFGRIGGDARRRVLRVGCRIRLRRGPGRDQGFPKAHVEVDRSRGV